MTLLKNRRFALLAGGQFTSTIGDSAYAVALPWYILSRHGGVVLLGTVLACYGIPRIALLAVGGAAADRWQPWRTMMAADTARVAAMIGMVVAILSGPPDARVLIPIALVLGAGEGLFMPGSMSIIPKLVPTAELQGANGFSMGLTQAANLAGPAIGGALVGLAGPALAMGVDLGTFVISSLTLLGISLLSRPGDDTRDEAGAETGEATAVTLRSLIRSSRALQLMILFVLAANLGSGGMGDVGIPALAHGPFHLTSEGYGILIAAFAGGALVGTVVGGHLDGLRKPMVIATLGFLCESIFFGAAPFLGGAIGAGFALALGGACNGFGNLLATTVLQKWVPANVMGRCMGLIFFCAYASFPVSVLVAGALVSSVGVDWVFVGSGAVLLIPILISLPLREWRDFGAAAPATHLGDAADPEVARSA